ncbi:hypothetical protein TVAG_205580 [Trichomonas vaginalis G3]|uniref:Uncharacterized protein n=1 Tax=Trichomonas vaginalis (strain ATCC PRA-98 / G3) TaxID=412133 RepID=A2FJE7_TRIV3|nr:hypothetical protein TVAGG3_0873290 [Trichomonas vaginalis G3]EAX94960.1 hypothetical protein TVAG_205580 [Trichomonas vaginalis G3]KAI5501512.1 hypothetical protein TVAGG3_0873290 [Trichomonas vaginalis G3]|eukprot:XP_001307890.1 hypothetical protein [Trichomonas vaginalis G3]
MCGSKKNIGLILLAISSVASLIGICCWVVGSLQPRYNTSKYLTSIPVFPTTEDKRGLWVSTVYNNESEIYNESKQIIIDLKPTNTDQNSRTVYLVHNMFYLNTSIAFLNSKNKTISSKSFNVTYGLTNETDPLVNQNINLLLEFMNSYGFFKIHCPYSTIITSDQGIEPLCNRSNGYPMQILHNFTATPITSIKSDYYNTTKYLSIDYGYFLPSNYIHTPQIYLVSWAITKSSEITLSGAIITGFGFLVLTASIGMFVSMINDD